MGWMIRAFREPSEDARLRVLDRATVYDRTFVPALATRATVFRLLGREDDAAKVVERCLDIAPSAVGCLEARATSLETGGKCAQAEDDVRRWLDLQPESRAAHELLASLLAGQERPVEAVREALGGADGGAQGGQFLDMVSMLRGGALPMLGGDFTEVVRVAKAEALRVSASPNLSDHFLPASTQVLAYSEAGDMAGAGDVAMDYLARCAAWGQSPMHEAFMVAAAARAGRLAPTNAERRIAAAFRTLVTLGGREPDAWLMTYAWSTDTPREARAAISVLDQIHAPLPPNFQSAKARTFFLAGRGELASPILEKLTRWCSLELMNTRNWAQSHLYLGELDEQKGDTAGACDHYAKVLARWGHARPRSVTADEARARSKAIGCVAHEEKH